MFWGRRTSFRIRVGVTITMSYSVKKSWDLRCGDNAPDPALGGQRWDLLVAL